MGASTSRVNSPLEATYTINGAPYTLSAGRFQRPAAPGSAALETLTVSGEPSAGDLDGDGDDDAALILVYQGGGSGTFYYLAAAVATDGRYQGTAALLLGDRIEPRSVAIHHATIAAQWRDRPPAASLATVPTVAMKRYAYLKETELVFVPVEATWTGNVTLAHEVRAFRPCGSPRDFWLRGDSPAYADVLSAYRVAVGSAPAYTPLYVVLAGHRGPPPDDGFGADYEIGFVVDRLLESSVTVACAEQDSTR